TVGGVGGGVSGVTSVVDAIVVGPVGTSAAAGVGDCGFFTKLTMPNAVAATPSANAASARTRLRVFVGLVERTRPSPASVVAPAASVGAFTPTSFEPVETR